eukprot:jgi/Hompol1/4500/HPOL_001788-RA
MDAEFDIDIDIEGEEGGYGASTNNDATRGYAANDSPPHIPETEYPEPAWLEADPTDLQQQLRSADMDEQSKALIESMLAEEAHYFGHSSHVGDPSDYTSKPANTAALDADPQSITKLTASTPVSGNQKSTKKKRIDLNASGDRAGARWTTKEDRAFISAIKMHGFGAWDKISNVIGTRSAKQVMVHAKHLIRKGVKIPGVLAEDTPRVDAPAGLPSAVPPMTPAILAPLAASHIIKLNAASIDDVDEDIDIDIDVDDDEDIGFDGQAGSTPVDDQGFTGVSKEEIDVRNSRIDDTPVIDTDTKANLIDQPSDFACLIADKDTGHQPAVPVKAGDSAYDSAAIPSVTESTLAAVKVEDPDIPTMKTLDDLDAQTPLPPALSTANIDDQPFLDDSTSVKDQHHLDPLAQNNVGDDGRGDTEVDGLDADGQDDEEEDTTAPFEDFTIIRDQIKPFEMEFCPEWFLGVYTGKRANKTPDRYMKIRNHILDLWAQMQPAAVSKSRIRPGLKGEGDVNAISRVHSFLESVGAINAHARRRGDKSSSGGGSDSRSKKASTTSFVQATTPSSSSYTVLEGSVAPMRYADDPSKRRRRVRTANGDWVWELEGTTLVHVDESEEQERKLLKKNAKYFADEELEKYNVKRRKTVQRAETDVMGKYDPFKLIPLRKFENEHVGMFHVKVHSNALVIMDFHSHLAHTEIIGLLGGKFDPVAMELSISHVFPCNSLSTGVQCEMDPVSEMEAREWFRNQDLDVVGWYHSHPTFEPNPSIRDIENQTLFRRADGTEPFVGVIVSPFDRRTPVLISRFQFITVSQEWNSAAEYRIPYACVKSIIPSPTLPPELFVQISSLQFVTRFTTTTRLEKLMNSLESHVILGVTQAQAKLFLDRVRDVIERGFSLNLRSDSAANTSGVS